ncbi:MAG: hypothetical protein BMS9Abin02_1978 [Anaerolineae bacterium]|nr:MAG: hypothetical protein BMS9Abin02_1978 [Anaerolineae bacterium]
MLESIVLEPEQEDLLFALVEGSRNVSRENRTTFIVSRGASSSLAQVSHPGLPKAFAGSYIGDFHELIHQGLLRRRGGGSSSILFDVSPYGFKYYDLVKLHQSDPIKRIEDQTISYLDSATFRTSYPKAYDKWAMANSLLWSSDSEKQYTTIGHLCRESIQLFTTSLVNRFHPTDFDTDKSHDINRLTAVVNSLSNNLGISERHYLNSLVAYWKALSGLVQRQEHGAMKEGEELIWEDARRLVFQSANVMFEVDRSLSRSAN